MHNWLKELIFVSSVVVLSTLLAFGFEQLNLRRENILLIYIASIMLITVQTKSIRNGLFSTFVLVFVFNFFFTEPKYTFIIDDVNYIITLVIFGIALLIIGSQTTTLQHQISLSKSSTKKIETLYELSSKLHQVNGQNRMIEMTLFYLKSYLNRSICFMSASDEVFGDQLVENHHISVVKRMIKDKVNGGAFEIIHRELGYKVLMVQSKNNVYGALCVDCMDQDINREDLDFTKTVLLLMSNVLERDKSLQIEQSSRLEYEKERFKTMMLRSISHDLRTPLTTLQTGLSFLEQSYDLIEEQTKMSMIKELFNETSQLSDFVENILYMTRLNAKEHVLNMTSELVEDIFNSTKERVSHRLGEHHVTFDDAGDEMIDVDGQLIIQTLTNLIDNAIKHTHPQSKINIHFTKLNKSVQFDVSDNGGGISEEQLSAIFNDYTSFQHISGDKKRGVGLDLSICKTIVEAHGGWIQALNNTEGGATFRFEIPSKGGDINEES